MVLKEKEREKEGGRERERWRDEKILNSDFLK